VLARLRRFLDHRKVLRVGRADVDGIDRRIAQDALVIGRRCGNGEACAQVSRRLFISARDCGSFDELHAPQRFEMNVAHKAGTENCRFDRLHREFLSVSC
jgi:hypothetical protein